MPTDKKTINAYNSFAAEWCEKIKNGKNLAQIYIEKPAMYERLNKIITPHSNILCIGCGTGEECNYIKENYTKNVIGIDISEGMISEAKKSNPGIEYHIMDMEQLHFNNNSFDIVYSSLSLYFFKDIDTVLKEVYRVLKDGGFFLFSMPHPLKWGSHKIDNDEEKTYSIGFSYYNGGSDCKVWGDYLTVRSINDYWFNQELEYFHHPIENIMQSVISSSFKLLDFAEPKAVNEAKAVNCNFWNIHQKYPLFIIYLLIKS